MVYLANSMQVPLNSLIPLMALLVFHSPALRFRLLAIEALLWLPMDFFTLMMMAIPMMGPSPKNSKMMLLAELLLLRQGSRLLKVALCMKWLGTLAIFLATPLVMGKSSAGGMPTSLIRNRSTFRISQMAPSLMPCGKI